MYLRRLFLLNIFDICFLSGAFFISFTNPALPNWFIFAKISVFILVFNVYSRIYPRGYIFKKGLIIEKRFFRKKSYLVESSDQIVMNTKTVIVISGKEEQKKLYIDPRKYEGNMVGIIEELYME